MTTAEIVKCDVQNHKNVKRNVKRINGGWKEALNGAEEWIKKAARELADWLRIPVKAIRVPEGRRSAFLRNPIRGSERSDAGEMIVAEGMGIVKRRNRSAAQAGSVEELTGLLSAAR
jgi:hypothetical protein